MEDFESLKCCLSKYRGHGLNFANTMFLLKFATFVVFILILDIHEFHMTSSTWLQGVGNKINLKTDGGWESNFLPGTDNTLQK